MKQLLLTGCRLSTHWSQLHGSTTDTACVAWAGIWVCEPGLQCLGFAVRLPGCCPGSATFLWEVTAVRLSFLVLKIWDNARSYLIGWLWGLSEMLYVKHWYILDILIIIIMGNQSLESYMNCLSPHCQLVTELSTELIYQRLQCYFQYSLYVPHKSSGDVWKA